MDEDLRNNKTSSPARRKRNKARRPRVLRSDTATSTPSDRLRERVSPYHYDEPAITQLYTQKHFARIFKVDINTVRKWIDLDIIPYIRVHETIRIPDFWVRRIPWGVSEKQLRKWSAYNTIPKFDPVDVLVFVGNVIRIMLETPASRLQETTPSEELRSIHALNVMLLRACESLEKKVVGTWKDPRDPDLRDDSKAEYKITPTIEKVRRRLKKN